MPRTTVQGYLTAIKNGVTANDVDQAVSNQKQTNQPKRHVTIETGTDTAVASSSSTQIKTLDELLKATNVDLNVWVVERHAINKWEVVLREPATTVGGAGDDAVISTSKDGAKSTLWTRASNQPMHEELYQIKIWLKRKSPQIIAGESILAKIRAHAPFLPTPAIRRKKLASRRALEVCIMDPHIGLLCQKPEADAAWDIDLAAATIMDSIDDLVEKASAFGPFEQAFMPFGNDFVHSDTVFHTTTTGTAQPESIAWHHVYERAEEIAIQMVERLRAVAKELYIYEVPGNHSRMADYTLRTCSAPTSVPIPMFTFALTRHPTSFTSSAPTSSVTSTVTL